MNRKHSMLAVLFCVGAAAASVHAANGPPNGAATLIQTASGALIEREIERQSDGRWVPLPANKMSACVHVLDHDAEGEHISLPYDDHDFPVEYGAHSSERPYHHIPADGVSAQVLDGFVRIDGAGADGRGGSPLILAERDDAHDHPLAGAGAGVACALIE